MDKGRIDEIISIVNSERNLKTKSTNIVKDFLIVDIESIYIAVQIEYLREVFDIQDRRDIATIPFTPAYIMGIINVRSEIIPVLYFSHIIEKHGKDDEYEKMVIIEHKKMKIGFPVRNIVDLKTVEVRDIREIKDIKKKSDNAFITEEFEVEETSVGILDIPRFFTSEFIK